MHDRLLYDNGLTRSRLDCAGVDWGVHDRLLYGKGLTGLKLKYAGADWGVYDRPSPLSQHELACVNVD